MGKANPARVLSIAGSDSGGGAGIQADIKTITMLGGHAMTAVTAITAQNSQGVSAVETLSPDILSAQIKAVLDDFGADAIKIGMLGSAANAQAVADILADHADIPIVFDPVMVATSGAVLADSATIAAFSRLIAIAALVTPNLPELQALGGEDALRKQSKALLIKGGHGADDLITDTLYHDGNLQSWANPRIATTHSHGTGCTLSSAIATSLGQGLKLDMAVERGIDYVRCALAHAPDIVTANGPMGHTLGRVPFDDYLEKRQ